MSESSDAISERVKQSEPWNSTKGIFADYSDGFDKPKFYVRCPNCNDLHGHYKTPSEAVLKRLCPGCHARSIEKLRKQIRTVNTPARRKPQEPTRLFVEAIVADLLNL